MGLEPSRGGEGLADSNIYVKAFRSYEKAWLSNVSADLAVWFTGPTLKYRHENILLRHFAFLGDVHITNPAVGGLHVLE